jgi:hypothetical protein
VTDDTTTAAPGKARLILTRNSKRDVTYRQIFASLDGNSLGDMVFGERIEREIPAGSHRLRVHNTLFWKTIDFEAAPGEVVEFSTVNYEGRGFWGIALIIGVAPLFLAVERQGGTGAGSRDQG